VLAAEVRTHPCTQSSAPELLATYCAIAVNPVGALSTFTETLVVAGVEVTALPFASLPLIVREKEWLNPNGRLAGVYVNVVNEAAMVELITVLAVVSVSV
jgi:hypothetical protein